MLVLTVSSSVLFMLLFCFGGARGQPQSGGGNFGRTKTFWWRSRQQMDCQLLWCTLPFVGAGTFAVEISAVCVCMCLLNKCSPLSITVLQRENWFGSSHLLHLTSNLRKLLSERQAPHWESEVAVKLKWSCLTRRSCCLLLLLLTQTQTPLLLLPFAFVRRRWFLSFFFIIIIIIIWPAKCRMAHASRRRPLGTHTQWTLLQLSVAPSAVLTAPLSISLSCSLQVKSTSLILSLFSHYLSLSS